MDIPKPRDTTKLNIKHELDDSKVPKSAKFLLAEVFISHSGEDAFTMTLGPSEQFADCLHKGAKKGMQDSCRNNLNKARVRNSKI